MAPLSDAHALTAALNARLAIIVPQRKPTLPAWLIRVSLGGSVDPGRRELVVVVRWRL